ncbi:MAG: hypothetical protein ACLTS1_05445 [Coprococcus sp.]|jgi:hypothetical protein|uniref:hypothetical protein n=1 Tax=Blautia wexlerae TaxID=418240 RepID=UPI001F8FD8D7|nr:hypothetical protein [Eubacterium sp.]
MNQKYISLELAIANDDLDLFFQGSGIYSFGDNIFYPVRRSVMADEAMNIIYSYYGETLNQSIVEKVEKCIYELLSYRTGKGIYKAFEILASIMKSEKEGKATFVCNTPKLRMAIEESVANNTEKLKNIRENESASISGGMYELIHTENIYYYKKYGFLIIRNASKEEIENIRKYMSREFSLKDERLERAIDKITCYRDICEESLYWINNQCFVDDSRCLKIEGFSAKKLYKTTYLQPIGAYNYLVYLRNNPQAALENLKSGLPRK